jgi:hypothetical protein
VKKAYEGTYCPRDEILDKILEWGVGANRR